MNNQIDTRLKLFSHSSIGTLRSCPRKYQLSRLSLEYVKEESIHTYFGKMFGEGVQRILAGTSLEESLLIASTHWKCDLWDTEKEKSFWSCWQALELFDATRKELELNDYSVVMWNDKPAIELSFILELPHGFYYRGYIDILLRHNVTGALLVVDAKTSGRNFSDSAMYQNSEQALSYSVIIDTICPGSSSYQIMYFEYLTRLHKFVCHTFSKDFAERANWIRDLLTEIEIARLYSRYDSWPMHGNSCVSFGRKCGFLDTCTMATSSLIGEPIYTDGKEHEASLGIKYDIEVTLQEVIDAQLSRS